MNDMVERIDWRCQRLSQQGFPMALKNILTKNPRCLGLIHLIVTISLKGYAADRGNALRLADPAWQEVRPTPFTIHAAIEQVYQAGGVAVLAYPCIVRLRRGCILIEDMRGLVEAGLDGIEVYHWRMPVDEEVLAQLRARRPRSV